MKTRIVGPWRNKEDRESVVKDMLPMWRERARPFRYAGQYWLEIWPLGSKLGDDVTRASMPQVGALPPLKWWESPNQSVRLSRVTGIVWHETQGSYLGAASWLANPRSRVSAHILINEDGTEAFQQVLYGRKAWHASNANDYTIGIELAGFENHDNNPAQIRAAARIGAAIGKMYGIPPIIGDSKGRGGHVTHESLGVWGGNHSDPGGFDFQAFVRRIAYETGRGGLKPYGRV